MRLLPTISLLACLGPALADNARIVIQRTPLAGSQYYAADACWQQLRPGDPLTLVREPENRHDPQAVRVEWQGRQLGYLPRAHNRPIAAALDAGTRLSARISRLKQHPDPWQRVEFEVLFEL